MVSGPTSNRPVLVVWC